MDKDDGLNAARGIINGLKYAMIFWVCAFMIYGMVKELV